MRCHYKWFDEGGFLQQKRHAIGHDASDEKGDLLLLVQIARNQVIKGFEH
jgi:hypothetical protein